MSWTMWAKGVGLKANYTPSKLGKVMGKVMDHVGQGVGLKSQLLGKGWAMSWIM